MNRQSSERLPLPDASVPQFLRDREQSMTNDKKVLAEDFDQCYSRKKLLEKNVKLLNLQQAATVVEIGKLQDCLTYDHSHVRECLCGKKLVIEKISCRTGSAAAAICRIIQYLPKEILENRSHEYTNNIVGVVACLGTAQTTDLSRILAKYLGEDQMLAIVCKSEAFASAPLEYDADGRINNETGLHKLAALVGLPISGKYVMICLDLLRVYTGEFCSDSERKLALPQPTLLNGIRPPGFLGYAVNMIQSSVGYGHWKTSSGHGLRETLFYNLFGKLQVYMNREDMNNSSSCITEDGAVSLDGGIIKNGVVTVGSWEPDIKFPVKCLRTKRHFPANNNRMIKEVDEKQKELREIADRLKGESEELAKATKTYSKAFNRYTKFLHEKAPLLRDFYAGIVTSNPTNNPPF